MKKLILTFIIGIISISNLTATPSKTKNCGCDLQNNIEALLVNKNLNTPQQPYQIKELTNKEIQRIAIRLCSNLSDSLTMGFDVNRFNKVILEGLEVNPNDPNINSIISNFLNKYKNKLICPRNTNSSISRAKYLWKHALWKGVIGLFDEMLFDDENYTIDFNAYEIVDGKKETVLDSIEVIRYAGRSDPAELDSLRDVIIELGG
ncbi:MAG: hypothetical protein QM499_11970 [Flavobacteriaceae bacterium]